jgi:hypothetical protein
MQAESPPLPWESSAIPCAIGFRPGSSWVALARISPPRDVLDKTQVIADDIGLLDREAGV